MLWEPVIKPRVRHYLGTHTLFKPSIRARARSLSVSLFECAIALDDVTVMTCSLNRVADGKFVGRWHT